jgi:hypothetical protein
MRQVAEEVQLQIKELALGVRQLAETVAAHLAAEQLQPQEV